MAFLLLFKHELKMHFPRWYSPMIQLVVSVATLGFYWYFSKAVEPTSEFKGEMSEGYFFYIIVGELTLLWPALFVSHPAGLVKQFYHKRALDGLLVLKQKAIAVLMIMTYSQGLIQSFKLALYLIALLLFSSQIEAFQFIYFLFLQILFLPLFMSLGVLSCCIVVYFGRGEKLIQVMVSASYVMAGVYFPVQVFPPWVQSLFALSPFNVLISLSRKTLYKGTFSMADFMEPLCFFTFGLALYIGAVFLFKLILEKCDRPINHYPLVS